MKSEEIEGDEVENEARDEFKDDFEGISIRIIRRSGDAVLVEWLDEDHQFMRASVPIHEIKAEPKAKNGLAKIETLELGIPYGLPWEEIIGEIKTTSKVIANTLRQHGIWTLEDIEQNPDALSGALQAAYKFDRRAIIKGARMLKEK